MNIIVTGASRGIGNELVKLLSKNSENKIIAIARNKEKLEELTTACFRMNQYSNVFPVVCDLGEVNKIKELESLIKKQFSSVHLVINNAAKIVVKPFSELTLRDFESVYSTNVFSVVGLIQLVIPLMDKMERTHIVNISSIGGFQGSAKFAGLSAYSSSKAALACLTECLAEEYKECLISFNCLALGATQTEMLEEAFPGYQAKISANQMASYIANFATTAHKFMNGKIIPVSLSTP